MAAATESDEEWPEDEVAGESLPELTGQLSLDIAPSEEVGEGGGERRVAISINVPDSAERRVPCDICCVVDISGSMGELASYELDGVETNDGFIVLDIVKHAVKTVVLSLQDGDRFALVAFDEKADRVLSLTAMTNVGQEEAIKAVNSLKPRGQTNIWDGVKEGMEALRCPAHEAKGRQRSLFLLTDGLPNISPPRGHAAELKDFKERNPDLCVQLNTFGFGYKIDSELLLGLALEGNGTSAFLPTALDLGTGFVNAVANALSSLTHDAILHVTPLNGAQFAGPVMGSFATTEATWGRVVSLGPLQLGQSRDVVVPLLIPAGSAPYLDATVIYANYSGKEDKANATSSQRTATQAAVVAVARSDLVGTGNQAVIDAESGRGKSAAQSVKDLFQRFAIYEAACLKVAEGVLDIRMSPLKADIAEGQGIPAEGRLTKALKGKERFNRWGKHYIRSLMRAHQVQQCTNYHDPGLQVYGGVLFRALRDKGGAIFESMPLPTPSRKAPPASVAVSTPYHAPVPSAAAVRRASAPSAPAYQATVYYGGGGGG